jgi:choline dehydrogenase-like flavoprotein
MIGIDRSICVSAPGFSRRPATNVRVLLHATLTQILTDASGSRLESVPVSSPEGKRGFVRSTALVLCAGGIENARLSLRPNRTEKKGVGNRYDLVGRLLMDHPRCTLCEFNIAESSSVRERYGLYRSGSEQSLLPPWAGVKPTISEQKHLLNCAAWLNEDRVVDDPGLLQAG